LYEVIFEKQFRIFGPPHFSAIPNPDGTRTYAVVSVDEIIVI